MCLGELFDLHMFNLVSFLHYSCLFFSPHTSLRMPTSHGVKRSSMFVHTWNICPEPNERRSLSSFRVTGWETTIFVVTRHQINKFSQVCFVYHPTGLDHDNDNGNSALTYPEGRPLAPSLFGEKKKSLRAKVFLPGTPAQTACRFLLLRRMNFRFFGRG